MRTATATESPASISTAAAPLAGSRRVSQVLWLVALMVADILTIGLILMHSSGLMAWQIAALVYLVWSPLILLKTRNLARSSRWMAVFFILVAFQTGHMVEHISQVVQLHLLGFTEAQASGLIGMLNLEWVHFITDDVIIPPLVFALLVPFRRNPWLWALLPLVLWHAAEHVVIMHTYLTTGVVGSPGLLAQGGLINGGLPITRIDLHFLYNLGEIILIYAAYAYQSRRSRRVPRPTSDEPIPAEELIPLIVASW